MGQHAVRHCATVQYGVVPSLGSSMRRPLGQRERPSIRITATITRELWGGQQVIADRSCGCACEEQENMQTKWESRDPGATRPWLDDDSCPTIWPCSVDQRMDGSRSLPDLGWNSLPWEGAGKCLNGIHHQERGSRRWAFGQADEIWHRRRQCWSTDDAPKVIIDNDIIETSAFSKCQGQSASTPHWAWTILRTTSTAICSQPISGRSLRPDLDDTRLDVVEYGIWTTRCDGQWLTMHHARVIRKLGWSGGRTPAAANN